MNSIIRTTRRKSVLFIFLSLVIGVATISATAKFWRQVTSTAPESTTLPQSPNGPRSKWTLLPIQLRQNGFLPEEVIKPAGDFELLLINASGEHDINIQLERDRGERVQTFAPQKGKNLRRPLHLGPGVYFLKVVNRPEWTCRLTITTP